VNSSPCFRIGCGWYLVLDQAGISARVSRSSAIEASRVAVNNLGLGIAFINTVVTVTA
jgi:hypothetical protein